VGTYVLILFRVFKCSYNYQHFEHHVRDDNLVHSDVRNVDRLYAPRLAIVAEEVSSTENPEVRLGTNTTGE
jgi:hypothetical protein